ncbi:hypothetical protein FA15DRAFT_674140, partial [Coprinopsis marcescibilis]
MSSEHSVVCAYPLHPNTARAAALSIWRHVADVNSASNDQCYTSSQYSAINADVRTMMNSRATGKSTSEASESLAGLVPQTRLHTASGPRSSATRTKKQRFNQGCIHLGPNINLHSKFLWTFKTFSFIAHL